MQSFARVFREVWPFDTGWLLAISGIVSQGVVPVMENGQRA
jgi:hypothetical protein